MEDVTSYRMPSGSAFLRWPPTPICPCLNLFSALSSVPSRPVMLNPKPFVATPSSAPSGEGGRRPGEGPVA